MTPVLHISTSYECPFLPGLGRCTLENLGGYIVGGTTHRPPSLIVVSQRCCQSEVSNLEVERIIQKKIAKFEVSVYDPLLMDVTECMEKLQDIVAHF